MITHSVKMSLPLRMVLATLAFAVGGFAGRALVSNCCAAYASARLAQAADEGQAQEAAYWIGRGANINTRDRFGDTPLMMAARNAHPDVTRVLLAHGAKANLRDDFGLSAAQWAQFHLHDSRAFHLASGFEIRQIPRPDALQTIAMLENVEP